MEVESQVFLKEDRPTKWQLRCPLFTLRRARGIDPVGHTFATL